MDELIQRQAVLAEIFKKPAWHNSDGSYYHADDIRDAVNSVKPQERTGHWIRITNGGAMKQIYLCSVCHRQIEDDGIEALITIKYPYCHCGAKMESEVLHEDNN